MKHLDLILAAGIAAAVLLGMFRDFSVKAEEVQTEVLRLHIPANSDSEEDQRIKLELRDRLLERYSAELSDSESLAEAERRTEELLGEIEEYCGDFLNEKGADYGVSAELTTMYFTTREYEDITLPAGNYKALRITLGSGEGHNWWCVMFPPLCLPAVSESAAETETLGDFRSEQTGGIKVKFALYEMIKELIGRN